MLDLLLNYSPVFVGGELLLALSLGMFGFALIGTIRERYSVRIPLASFEEPIYFVETDIRGSAGDVSWPSR